MLYNITMKDKYIPLTKSMMDTHKNHLYPYLFSIYYLQESETHYLDKQGAAVKIWLNKNNRGAAQKASGMSRQSFAPYAAPDIVLCQGEFVCMMPAQVWEDWVRFLEQQDKRSWNSWTKLFCYVYFNCSKHTGCTFTHSRDQFEKELGMQPASISSKLIALEQAGFIRRTNYNADQGIARAYLLCEKHWPEYRILEHQKLSTKS